MITKKAYAKVNMTLDIAGRREDGYHLVRMVMQSLNIADILTFEKIEDSGENYIQVLLKSTEKLDKVQAESREASDSDYGVLPLDENNLIYKAAKILIDKYVRSRNPKAGVKITLEKNIPIAAGMAGGSSDAAATLVGVKELFELTILEKDLMDIGVTLGADVPYCIMGRTALSEGIGEVLTRLPDMPDAYFVVAKPMVAVSTAEAYGGYDKLAETQLAEGKRLRHPDVDGQVDALYAGSLEGIASRLENVLEYVTAENHPEIVEIEKLMKENGALNAVMSGSGPTVFGIYDSKEKAEAAAKVIDESGLVNQLFVTTPVKG